MVKEEKEKPWDIGDRTLAFGVRAVRLYRALSETKDGVAWVIGKVHLRSAMSIGANIAEAATRPASFTTHLARMTAYS